jgi:hypothetical protein
MANSHKLDAFLAKPQDLIERVLVDKVRKANDDRYPGRVERTEVVRTAKANSDVGIPRSTERENLKKELAILEPQLAIRSTW